MEKSNYMRNEIINHFLQQYSTVKIKSKVRWMGKEIYYQPVLFDAALNSTRDMDILETVF